MSDPKEVIQITRDLIEKVKVAMLSTVDGNKPCLRPMAAFQVGDNQIWMATYSGSRKVAQIKANPNVELCFMDSEYNQVRLTGKARVVEDKESKDKLWAMVPEIGDYFKSADDPTYVVIQVTVSAIEYLEHGLGKTPQVAAL